MLKKKMFRKRLIKSLKIKKNLDNLNKMAATSKVKLTRWLRRCSTSKKLSKMMMKKKRTMLKATKRRRQLLNLLKIRKLNLSRRHKSHLASILK